MFEQIKVCLLKEWRYYYVSKIMILYHFINEAVILAVFWYTAKAFVPNLSVFGNSAMDYFTFILLGESVLRLPCFFVTVISRNIKNSMVEGTFVRQLLLPGRSQNHFIFHALVIGGIETLKVAIILLMAKIFFVFNIGFVALMVAFFYQLLALPLFIGLGLTAASVLIMLGRGDGVVMKGLSIAAILAGAYFPLTVLPEGLASFANFLSPFNLLLHATRELFTQSLSISAIVKVSLILIVWSMPVALFGYMMIGKALDYQKKRGHDRSLVL